MFSTRAFHKRLMLRLTDALFDLALFHAHYSDKENSRKMLDNLNLWVVPIQQVLPIYLDPKAESYLTFEANQAIRIKKGNLTKSFKKVPAIDRIINLGGMDEVSEQLFIISSNMLKKIPNSTKQEDDIKNLLLSLAQGIFIGADLISLR